jgi:hypothetical protein
MFNRGAKQILLLLVICLVTVAVYAKVTGAYFCAYDDFLVLHQAEFEDSRDPSHIFTTPHWNSPKYRPLNRLVSLWTFRASGDDALLYRVRNLSFHLVNVGLLYALAWLMFRSIAVSAVAATLFALHPLANQSVIGATWTNTVAHSLFLLALVVLFISLKAVRWASLLILSLLIAWAALLTYDPDITVLPLMGVGLAIYLYRSGRSDSSRMIALFCALSGALLAAYIVLRWLFVPRGWSQAATDAPGLAAIAKNTLMYVFALMTPLDPVLAHAWLKTPLPSEIVVGPRLLIAAGLAATLSLLMLGFAVRYFAKRGNRPRNVDWAAVMFLICATAAPLAPVLVFQSHSSETYLYLSAAFFALLLAYLTRVATTSISATNGSAIYTVVMIALVLEFSAATWVRNNRVVQCAATALRIVYSLPRELSAGGPWSISFLTSPESGLSRPYGFYAYEGIRTIGDDDQTLTAAVQVKYGSTLVTAKAVPPGEIPQRCRRTSKDEICIRVYADGKLETINGLKDPRDSVQSRP